MAFGFPRLRRCLSRPASGRLGSGSLSGEAMKYTLGRLAGLAWSVRSRPCGLRGDWRFVDQIAGWDDGSASSVSGTAFPGPRRPVWQRPSTGEKLGCISEEGGPGSGRGRVVLRQDGVRLAWWPWKCNKLWPGLVRRRRAFGDGGCLAWLARLVCSVPPACLPSPGRLPSGPVSISLVVRVPEDPLPCPG